MAVFAIVSLAHAVDMQFSLCRRGAGAISKSARKECDCALIYFTSSAVLAAGLSNNGERFPKRHSRPTFLCGMCIQ